MNLRICVLILNHLKAIKPQSEIHSSSHLRRTNNSPLRRGARRAGWFFSEVNWNEIVRMLTFVRFSAFSPLLSTFYAINY